MSSVVYGIICLANRKLYIGQSSNPNKRWSNHKYKLRKNIHFADRLQKAWNKYGPDYFKFVVIEEADPKEVYKRELWWIKTLETFKPTNGFNRHWKQAKKDKQKWHS